MALKSLGQILKAALVAGVIAGAIASSFHWVFTEPIIDRAVAIEKQGHTPSAGTSEEPVVSRPMQKLGLFGGFLIYGAAWGLLFGLLAYAVRPWFSKIDLGRQGFFLALQLGWAVAIFPMIQYPANPPGAGEAETIGYRQELFLSCTALSLVGIVLAVALKRWFGPGTWPMVLSFYATYLMLIVVALPSNPDPVKMPSELVSTFRILSLLGQLLFWGIMGGSFWWLCGRRNTRLMK